MFGSHKDLRLTTEQIKTIVEMLKKEEQIEAMQAFISGTVPYPPVASEDKKIATSVFLDNPADATGEDLKHLPTEKEITNLKSQNKPPRENCI